MFTAEFGCFCRYGFATEDVVARAPHLVAVRCTQQHVRKTQRKRQHVPCRYGFATEDVVARAPYMVAVGNHERDFTDSNCLFDGPGASDSGGECGVPHETRYLMPTAERDEPWCAAALLHLRAAAGSGSCD